MKKIDFSLTKYYSIRLTTIRLMIILVINVPFCSIICIKKHVGMNVLILLTVFTVLFCRGNTKTDPPPLLGLINHIYNRNVFWHSCKKTPTIFISGRTFLVLKELCMTHIRSFLYTTAQSYYGTRVPVQKTCLAFLRRA